jgi:Tfp pilus assembly protein PilE
MNNKWFTLIELLITIVIIWLLFVVLFRAYTTISQVTFRVQQEKNIQQEMIRITQTIQNIADTHSIDFNSYLEITTQDSLYLSWELGRIIITSTWRCKEDTTQITWFTEEDREDPCRLIFYDKNWKINTITTPSEIIISKPHFNMVTTTKNEDIISDTTYDFPFLYIQQAWFKVRFTIYTPIYKNNNRTNMSSTIFQQFFKLQ